MKIDYTGPSFTFNAALGMNRYDRAAAVKAWRDPLTMIVRQPRFRWRATGPVGIEVRSWCRADADRMAYAPVAKAMIDALNDDPKTGHVGWWPDDDGHWVHWEKHYVPVRDMSLPKGMVRVELEIVAVVL